VNLLHLYNLYTRTN
jgi:transposase InsO family protein